MHLYFSSIKADLRCCYCCCCWFRSLFFSFIFVFLLLWFHLFLLPPPPPPLSLSLLSFYYGGHPYLRAQRQSYIVVGWLLWRPSNMLVNLGGGYAQTIVRAATLRQKPQIKFAVSLGHGRPTPRKPVPRLVLQRQVWELLDTNFEVYGVTRSGGKKTQGESGNRTQIFLTRGRRLPIRLWGQGNELFVGWLLNVPATS